jgi:hypothetical protein
MKEFVKDLIETKAIYYFAIALALCLVSLYVDMGLFDECKAHGFSTFYCIMK